MSAPSKSKFSGESPPVVRHSTPSFESAETQAALLSRARQIVSNIQVSGKTILDVVAVGDPDFWFPIAELEALIRTEIVGLPLGQSPKTRSKIVKSRICAILGYPVPRSFPRGKGIPGQELIIATQASNNFQPVNKNAELVAERRYAIVEETSAKVAGRVRIITGERMAELDTTGTLTMKFQATFRNPSTPLYIASRDTEAATSLSAGGRPAAFEQFSPIDAPTSSSFLGIEELAKRLSPLVGRSFPDLGSAQDRNRGDALHRLVCEVLRYRDFAENGACPDIRHQLVEVKLQSAPTINIGLVSPDSTAPLDIVDMSGVPMLHEDVRYVVAGAIIADGIVTITDLTLTTGRDFYSVFPRFGGQIISTKRQICLPANFFDA